MRVFLQIIFVDFVLVIGRVFYRVGAQKLLVLLERLLVEVLVNLAVEMRAFVFVRLAFLLLVTFFLRFLRLKHPRFNALAALNRVTVDAFVHHVLFQFLHVLDDFVEAVVADLTAT